jgi:hypothetical protein
MVEIKDEPKPIKRLINTSNLRGINEQQYQFNKVEEEPQEIEDVTNKDEEPIKSPEELSEETKNQETVDYSDYIQNNSEIRDYLEYERLKDRVGKGKPITEGESAWLKDLLQAEEIRKQNEEENQKLMLEEKETQLKKEKEILDEYKRLKESAPQKIMRTDVREQSLSGGESVIQVLSFVAKLKMAKKKGGKVLIQVLRNKKVSFKWTIEDITFVEFLSKDEKGNDLLEITRFSEYQYSFEGTPVPVLFAIQGYAEGFDFYKDFRKDLTAELLSRISTRSFITGYMKGAEIRIQKEKKSTLESLQPLLPIILIGAIIILAWMMYSMYDEMQALRIAIEALNSVKVLGP